MAASSVQYLLSGVGSIEPLWIRACLALFRECDVNIRRLVLLRSIPQSSLSDPFSHLELQFTLPASEEAPSFLRLLENRLTQQRWRFHQLSRLDAQ